MKIHFSLFTLVAVFIVFFLSVDGHSFVPKNQEDSLDLTFYSTDVPVRFIVVEKSKQQLLLFEQQQSLKLLKTFVCATGENPGKKSISGDSKTPEGLYFITEVYEDKKITVFGSRAYHLDYPNIFDKHAGHLGDGIFIHGTNKTLIPYSTNGCITLANDDLDELANYLKINAVPVIVLENLPAPLLGTNLKIEKNDNRFKDILDELSFAPFDFSTDNVESLSFLTLGSQAIASISYRIYDKSSLEYRYHKRVYLTAKVSEDWHTLYSVESQDIIPTILAVHPVKNQYVGQTELPDTVAAQIASPDTIAVQISQPDTVAAQVASPDTVAVQMDMDSELLAFVKKWQTAWIDKNIETYIECYSPSFRNGQLDLKGWRERKSYLNKRYTFIQVAIQNIVIEWTDAGANVSFFQEYKSDQYQTSGTKLLQIINRDNKWLIQKEIM